MIITVTDDHEKLVELFNRNGLEFHNDPPIEKSTIVKCWKVMLGEQLIAGCILTNREGSYNLEGLAVEPAYRNSTIGSRLLELALNYLKEQKADNLYLLGKVPEFYKKHGFEIINRSESPITYDCFKCPQYKIDCFPEAMKINF